MEMIKVESSNIERIGYKDKLLRVEFKGKDGNNTTYDFPGCPLKIYNDFILAESKGKFFAKNVRGKFETRKISKDELMIESFHKLVDDLRAMWKEMDKTTKFILLDQVINIYMSDADCENKVDSK